MAVSAKMVKSLRQQTGAGMMDCKKALTETDGNLEEAVDWLRKKGLSTASKKAGRVAAEGKVIAISNGSRGVLLEANLETDFASKNEKFIAFANTTAQVILDNTPADVEALKALDYPGSGHNVGEELTQQIASIGENMNLRRFAIEEVPQGVVSTYIHMGGKIGVMVGVESAVSDEAALTEIGKKIAMHVAASAPPYLDRASVPEADLEREKSVLTEQAKSSGKPDNIIEKMVIGRINKFYGENCLLEQPFVMDPDQKVGKFLTAEAKKLGADAKLTGYVRFALGEGIDKGNKDFAEEVAQQLG
ncbi:MAG: elongation factor Ts [Magnetococcales bacterium]|nr:elongation factor Ts [Magnetococcales bacterium]